MSMPLSVIWISHDRPTTDTERLLNDAFNRVEFRGLTEDAEADRDHVLMVADDGALEQINSILAHLQTNRFVVWVHSDEHLPSQRSRRELLGAGCLDVLSASDVHASGALHALAARAQGALARLATAEQYKRMVKHSQDVFTVIDSAGIIRYESPSLKSMLGYEPADMTGKEFSEFVHEADRARLLARLAEYGTEEGVRVSEEYRFRHADGSWRILESFASTIRTASGSVEIIVSSRDVTHFWTAVEEVRRREEQLSEAQRITHIGSWEWELGTDQMDWSLEHYRIYGFEFGSPVSYTRFLEAIHPDDRDTVRSAIASCNDTHESFSVHHRILRNPDEERIVNLRGGIVLTDAGHPRAMFGTSHDVTDTERSKATARLTQNRFRELFKLSPDAILLTHGDGTVFDANRSADDLFDVTTESLLGRRVQDLLAAAWRSSSPTIPQGSIKILTLSGVERPVTAHVNKIEEPGDTTQIVYLRDDHERLRNEKLLRNLSRHQGQVLEEERTRISREVHDVLGQELTALKMDVAWVTRHYGDDDGLARLDEIDARLSSTLETARRIAHGLRPGILDDFGLAAAVEWQARQFGDRTGIRVRTGTLHAPDLSNSLTTAVFRILQELLTNVARHAKATTVDVGLDNPGENLVLTVTDDGVGIRQTTDDSHESLGLLGMRERIMPWRGRLEVNSQPGKGTSVEVIIPIDPHENPDS